MAISVERQISLYWKSFRIPSMASKHCCEAISAKVRRLIVIKLLGSVLFLFFSGLVFADSDYLELSLEELLSVKVTGASLRAQEVRQIPASVNTFTAKSIKMLGVHTLHELVRFVPGFQVYRADDSVNFNIVTRGKTVGNSSREILLLIDGVRVDNWFDGGSAALGRIPLYNVERVEFIRGPVSQVYGANAFLGVINIVTQNDKKGATVAAGNLHARQFSASYNHALLDSVGEKTLQQVFSLDYYSDEGEDYSVTDPFDMDGQVDITDSVETLYANYKLLLKDWEFRHYIKTIVAKAFIPSVGFIRTLMIIVLNIPPLMQSARANGQMR